MSECTSLKYACWCVWHCQASSLTQFSLVVLDVNDESPTFFPVVYNVSLPENIPRDFKVVRLNCTDADVGLNAELSYFITGMTSSLWKTPTSCWYALASEAISVIGNGEHWPILISVSWVPPFLFLCSVYWFLLIYNQSYSTVSWWITVRFTQNKHELIDWLKIQPLFTPSPWLYSKATIANFCFSFFSLCSAAFFFPNLFTPNLLGWEWQLLQAPSYIHLHPVGGVASSLACNQPPFPLGMYYQVLMQGTLGKKHM